MTPQEKFRAISGGVVFAEKGADWLAAFEHDLDEALAAERRATVERIRAAAESKHPYKGPHPRLQAYSPGPGIPNTYIWRPDLLAILDAEADR